MSLKWNDTVVGKIDQAIKVGLTACAMQVKSQAKALIKEKKVIDTGRLLNSIEYKVNKDNAVIGTNVEYAIYNEFGTKFMPPRSFLREGLDLVKPDLQPIFTASWKKVMGND
jgi:HK97 gp10 family phage protein